MKHISSVLKSFHDEDRKLDFDQTTALRPWGNEDRDKTARRHGRSKNTAEDKDGQDNFYEGNSQCGERVSEDLTSPINGMTIGVSEGLVQDHRPSPALVPIPPGCYSETVRSIGNFYLENRPRSPHPTVDRG